VEILNESSGKLNDRLVTIFAIFAIFMAAAISFATLGNHEIIAPVADDPNDQAMEAAEAGIQAAKGHIECHSLKSGGSLPRQYFVNGGRFDVAWSALNPEDSTVQIVSTGYYEVPGMSDEFGAKNFCARLETNLKVNLIPTHNQAPILAKYYQRSQPKTDVTISAAR
jgi:hypothetical protein